MARRTIDLPTTQEIEQLYDTGNIEKLREYNEKFAKTANQRMVQLAKSGIRSSAPLERAKFWIFDQELGTGGVFSRSKKLNAELLVEQLKEELIFLRSQSSTVRGEKERRALQSFETLTTGTYNENGEYVAPYLELPEDVNVPKGWTGTRQEYFQHKFLQFLSQDAWKDIKKYLYTTKDNDLFKQAGEAIARGAKISDLTEAYKAYLRGEVSVYTMWDQWTSVK